MRQKLLLDRSADNFASNVEAKIRSWICHGKSSPAPPPSPDYAGAARATAEGNLEATRYATEANRYNQYTPYGSQTWQRPTEENPDQWSSTISLEPQAQQALDSQLALSQQMGSLAEDRAGAVGESFNQPMDNSVDDVYNRAYETQTARLDPQFQRSEEQLNTRLANQGIRLGSEAYSNAQSDFNQGKNDAYTQARTAAINTMPMTQQLASALRNQPLNELNAIRTGAQIQNPTFQQAGMQQATAGPDMLGAANAQNQYGMGLYNSQVAGDNSAMSGIMSLAGTLGGAALKAGMFSDVRLKSNITRIGTHPLGIGVYEYDIFGRREIGVMAQELIHVKPDAVHVHPSGYFMVDYGALNA